MLLKRNKSEKKTESQAEGEPSGKADRRSVRKRVRQKSGTNNNEKKKEIKNKKNNEKKKKAGLGGFSIAFQISAERLVMRAVSSVGIDILYVLLMAASFIYNAVMTEVGSFKELTDLRFNVIPDGNIMAALGTAVVGITSGGSETIVTAGHVAQFTFVSLLFIVTIQFILLLVACVVVPSKTYDKLRPLYTMTEAAKALNNLDAEDSDFSRLEDAISELSPNNGELEIHTGKEELAGLEEAVNDLLRRTRNSYQSQIRFVSDASHELRTPIAVIQGYANMLDRWGREDKEILNESIASIKSEAENMNRLVENLLFLARGDSGRAIIRFEELDINRLICDIYDEFVMIDSTHEFQLDLRTDVRATADPSLVKQCMRILIDNAVKYSPEGTDIILRLNKRDEKYFAIEVQDYGIGIRQDEADKIFERFYRSDPARNRQTGGYGLGLSIAKWIADKHKGFFEVLSYENLGTRISLVLPFDPVKSGKSS